MIYTWLKCQDETPSDYQYTLFKNEGKKGKTGLLWETVSVGGLWAQGKGEYGGLYSVFIN
jgi:hypothetical protein